MEKAAAEVRAAKGTGDFVVYWLLYGRLPTLRDSFDLLPLPRQFRARLSDVAASRLMMFNSDHRVFEIGQFLDTGLAGAGL